MKIVYDDRMLRQYMRDAVSASPEHPVLIDKFVEDAFEFDVDAVYDGRDLLLGGVMQHIEEAGIHSGDSACVLPPYLITPEQLERIELYTRRLARALKVKGLLNVQYAMRDGGVYVLEVNPRASRTVPFVSKAIGLPLAKVAARVMVGRSLKQMGLTRAPQPRHVSVKEAVLPFSKFSDVSIYLGPEMRSTGEVMGISYSLGNAFAKSQIAAGASCPPPARCSSASTTTTSSASSPSPAISSNWASISRPRRHVPVPARLRHRLQPGAQGGQGQADFARTDPPGKDPADRQYAVGQGVAHARIRNRPRGPGLQRAVHHHPVGRLSRRARIMSAKNKTLAVRSLQEYHG